MAELKITLSDGRKSRYTLGDRPAVVGRDPNCDIPIDDASASRRHARFVPAAHGHLIEDMRSKNGTLVNDVPCTSKLLQYGDQIQVGSTAIQYAESTTSSAGSVVITDEATTSHATRYISREKHLLLSQQRLEMIYALSARLTTLQSQQQLLETAMNICVETLQFERAAIGVRPVRGRGLDWPVVRNLRGAQGELTISRSLLTRALEHGERAIFADDGSGSADPTVSMVQHGIRSAMCVPLLQQDRTIGVIYGDRLSTSAAYASEDIDFLAGIAHHISIGLINCRLLEEQQHMVQMERDLTLARTIQGGLFPAHLPNRPELAIAALNDPGDRVSGDYYDVIETKDGRVLCLIADVAGEGVAAALLMANLQAAVRVMAEHSDDPGFLLGQWNRLICRNTEPSKFITCLVALIDPAGRTIQLASAGHCPPLLRRRNQKLAEELSVEPGFPLGIVPDAQYTSTPIRLGSEPVAFLCYTDGVVEAMNEDHAVFQVESLRKAVGDLDELEPQAMIRHVREQVAVFAAGAKQSDDITLLAARVG